MHFKWDSSVARDISKELYRLQEELGDSAVEIDRCAAILRDMAKGPDELIEKYLAVAEDLKKGMRRLAEGFEGTSRGIDRASELFDRVEEEARRRAEGGDERLPTFEWGAGGERGAGNGPVFYNIPEAWGTAPIGAGEGRRAAPWPALDGVSRAVVIDRGMPGGMIVPPWLAGILDSER